MTSQAPPRNRSPRTPAPPPTPDVPPRPSPAVQASQPIRKSMVPQKKSGADWHGLRRIKLELSLALALLVVLGLVHAPLQVEREFVIAMADQEIVEMEEITQTKQPEKPPPPPQPPVPVEVPNDAVLDANIDLNLDATFDINEPLANLPPPPPPPAREVAKQAVEEEEIFVAVEEMPELIGGMQALRAQIKYPEIALHAGVEGRVVVQFVVDENGFVRDAFILKSQGAGLDEEALRVVSTARFKPGKQRGKAVKVRMSIPINFQLRDVK